MALDQLLAEELYDSVAGFSFPETIRLKLLEREDIQSLIRETKEGLVTERDVTQWVARYLQDLRPGIKFPHDLSFAALCVVLERVPAPFAHRFLDELAKLNIQEMYLCRTMARICLAIRAMEIAYNSVVVKCETRLEPNNWPYPEWHLDERPFRVSSSVEVENIIDRAA